MRIALLPDIKERRDFLETKQFRSQFHMPANRIDVEDPLPAVAGIGFVRGFADIYMAHQSDPSADDAVAVALQHSGMRRPGDVVIGRLRKVSTENQRRAAHGENRHHGFLAERRQVVLTRRPLFRRLGLRSRHLKRSEGKHIKIRPEGRAAEFLEFMPVLEFERIDCIVVPCVGSHADHIRIRFVQFPASPPDVLRTGRKAQQNRADDGIDRFRKQRHMVGMFHDVIQFYEIHGKFFGQVFENAPVIFECAALGGVGCNRIVAPGAEVVRIVNIPRPAAGPLYGGVPFQGDTGGIPSMR